MNGNFKEKYNERVNQCSGFHRSGDGRHAARAHPKIFRRAKFSRSAWLKAELLEDDKVQRQLTDYQGTHPEF